MWHITCPLHQPVLPMNEELGRQLEETALLLEGSRALVGTLRHEKSGMAVEVRRRHEKACEKA